MFISKFDSVDEKPDEDQIQTWVEGYFLNMVTTLNSFFVHVSAAEAVERMAAVPFAQLVTEELEGESEAIISLAVEIINELATTELEFMSAYI
ncbi:MAG: hypothetical protein GXY49_11135 [Syntrophomonadaceae bacterium]|nr:hypothetical protein [Syntrophomonadaceae bacterium]